MQNKALVPCANADNAVQAFDFIFYFSAQNVSVLSHSRCGAACDRVRAYFSTKLSTVSVGFCG
ncbi:MAG: hypothetical protein P4L96_14275 [Rhodoferax sp.]|nr:hypothetical protein [Rhodoferax sp.]